MFESLSMYDALNSFFFSYVWFMFSIYTFQRVKMFLCTFMLCSLATSMKILWWNMIIFYDTHHHEAIKTTKAFKKKEEKFKSINKTVIKIHQLFLTIYSQIDLPITWLNKWFVINDTQNDLAPCRHNVKPFVDPNEDYMYSRTCEVKSRCQFTHYGQRKHLGNFIWMHNALLQTHLKNPTMHMFHAPPCSKN